jgi:hypothetical protein
VTSCPRSMGERDGAERGVARVVEWKRAKKSRNRGRKNSMVDMVDMVSIISNGECKGSPARQRTKSFIEFREERLSSAKFATGKECFQEGATDRSAMS